MTRPRPQRPFWEQLRALARRDLVIQLSYKVELVMQLAAVFITVASFAFFAHLVPARRLAPYRAGYFEFALVGAATWQLAAAALRAFTEAVSRQQQEGTFEVLLTGTAPLAAIMIGGSVVPLTIALAQSFIITAFGFSVVGWGVSVGGAALAVPLIAVTVTCFSAIGLLSAGLVLLFKRGDPITAVLANTSVLLGGALFPIKVMPGWLQAVAHGLPPYYAIDGLRGALLGGVPISRVLVDIAILAAFAGALLPLALWTTTRALAAARRAGTLGTY